VVIDRFGPHKFLSAIVLAWSMAIIAIGQTANLAVGLTAAMVLLGFWRLVFGAAQAGCYPALSKVTREWFPFHQRTTVQGWIATTFGRSGGAMSPIIMGTLLMGTLGMNWQWALAVLGGVGIVYALLFWTLFRNTPGEHPRVNDAERELIALGTPAATTGALDALAGDLEPVSRLIANALNE
jgi:MFS family permease